MTHTLTPNSTGTPALPLLTHSVCGSNSEKTFHRSGKVKQQAEDLGIKLEPLPAYSPDFMPVEHLWRWLHEDVTYHACYDDKSKLIAQVQAFEQAINAIPTAVADRL